MRFFKYAWIVLAVLASQVGLSQTNFHESYFLDAKLSVDTSSFTWSDHSIVYQDKEHLGFRFQETNAVAEVMLYFDEAAPITGISLVPTNDYFLMDTVLVYDDYARFKIQFGDLTQSNFLKLLLKVKSGEEQELVELPLFPYTETYAELYPGVNELYIGEEKVFEITTNHVSNIQVDNRWSEGLPINYRVTREGGKLLLHLLPNKLGRQKLEVSLSAIKPNVIDDEVTYQIPVMDNEFVVKSGRLAFLQFDRQEVTPNDDKKEPIEIQLDNHRFLRLNRTYRIEDQEEEGGPLVAELYTKALLNNDKVLCLLRPYAFHRKSEGYLYIKDGDEPRFVTNLDITPKTTINQVYVQRNGRDWQPSTTVYPGETINVKLEGVGLHKANFSFPGARNLELDSLIKNENLSVFSIKVPININTSKIEIFNHNQATGTFLSVKEYQKAKNFDFVTLDFGDRQEVVSEVDKPIYYEHTLTDLVIDFNHSLLDRAGDLHGKQYLTVKVKISNKKGNLIELYQFDQIVVCPDESSPRFAQYDRKDCRLEGINLNNYLSKKTSELEEWSRIELEISHLKNQYAGSGFTKKVLIHLKRDYNFDIDVSFPAGLLILKGGSDDFANFGGPSFAMIAQMSFYQPGRIAKYRPYKIGAGFIAIDAFNFSDNSDSRDVGLVVIGSLYPTSSDNKLTFPLYAGFGYLMREQTPFFLIGPGIRVRL